MSEWYIGISNGTKEFVLRTQRQQLPIVNGYTVTSQLVKYLVGYQACPFQPALLLQVSKMKTVIGQLWMTSKKTDLDGLNNQINLSVEHSMHSSCFFPLPVADWQFILKLWPASLKLCFFLVFRGEGAL